MVVVYVCGKRLLGKVLQTSDQACQQKKLISS